MAANALDTRVSFQNDVAVIELSGEINAQAEESINLAYQKVEVWKPKFILLALANVNYINSTGIALIIGLLSRARKTQTRLMVCGLNDHYLEIFRITRLSDFIEIFPDEKAAIAHAGA
jgi:anti-anti-sigma factor